MNLVRSKRFTVLIVAVTVFLGCLLMLKLSPGANVLLPGILSMIVIPIALILTGAKYAPKPFNNYTTWFGVVFIGICLLNAVGQDDKNLLISLLSLDIIFSSLIYNESIRPILFNEEHFTFIGYVIRVGLGMLYGAMVDGLKFVVTQRKA